MKKTRKLIVIVGPTASGKSALAVTLAKKFGGEIISADSRQVYKGIEIGSGIPTEKEMGGIPHRLISFVNPKRTFTAAEYKRLARKEMDRAWKAGKLPILAGGTGLYIRAAVDGLVIPAVKPDPKLRRKLGKMSTTELSEILKHKDPRRWNEIDRKNPRRLMRAVEIAETLGRVPELRREPIEADVIFIGVLKNEKKLEKNVRSRAERMIKKGLISETEKLRKAGPTRKKIGEFGFEYSAVLDYLDGKLGSKKELADEMTKDTLKYAKRQMTWFKRDGRIIWVNSKLEASRRINEFMRQNAKTQMTNDKSMTNA